MAPPAAVHSDYCQPPSKPHFIDKVLRDGWLSHSFTARELVSGPAGPVPSLLLSLIPAAPGSLLSFLPTSTPLPLCPSCLSTHHLLHSLGLVASQIPLQPDSVPGTEHRGEPSEERLTPGFSQGHFLPQVAHGSAWPIWHASISLKLIFLPGIKRTQQRGDISLLVVGASDAAAGTPSGPANLL